jgi:hypothetical protein
MKPLPPIFRPGNAAPQQQNDSRDLVEDDDESDLVLKIR